MIKQNERVSFCRQIILCGRNSFDFVDEVLEQFLTGRLIDVVEAHDGIPSYVLVSVGKILRDGLH